MGLFKIFFRTVRISKRHSKLKTRVVVAPKQTRYQSNDTQLPPVLESKIILTIKDVEQIQKLPSVKVKHVIDGDTVIVESKSSQVKIRLDSIDCPEQEQEWGEIATRGLIKLIGGKSVKLEVHGSDAHDRTLATLFVYLQDKAQAGPGKRRRF